MKRLWVIGCMYVCMVSSFELLCSAAGAPSGGAGASAGFGGARVCAVFIR
jgi:hypothetical protein